MTSLDFDLLKRLSEAAGVPSREHQVRSVVVEALRPIVDELRIDRLGNVVALKRGSGSAPRRKLMIAAHMDEIGFLVSHVEKEGFLRLQPLGGFDPRSLFAQRVLVHTTGGQVLHGVMMPAGGKPPHLMAGEEAKGPKVADYFVDVGLPVERVNEIVEIGDMVTMDRTLERAGDMIVGKAMDDRAGVFVMIEAIRALRSHEVDVVGVATVQEEVGLRGATTAAFGIEPDIGIALDGTLAVDIPESKDHEHVSKLGKGVAIKVMDSSSISDPRMVNQFRDIARRERIPFQMEILPRGGTDAGSIQRSRAGVPTITLSVPTRYVHTVNEMVSERDVEAAVTLLARYVEAAHTFEYDEPI